MSSLLTPVALGDLPKLPNRICMGSMTRNRCVDDNKPTQASVEHYADRARDGAALIVAEGTFVYYNGAEWPHAPLMMRQEHADAWKPVVEAVHKEGGKILFQPWHPGRIQNDRMPMSQKTGTPVYAASAIPAAGGKFRELEGKPGHTENVTPIEDPKAFVEEFRTAVTLAKDAGFDGVELLSQGGYLLHNFLCSRSNRRTDKYGGSVENRCRFPLEVVDAIISVWGPRRLGIKLCPSDDYNDSAVSFSEQLETYDYYIRELVKRDVSFINLSRRGCQVAREQDDYFKTKPRPEGLEIPGDYEPLQKFGHLIKYPGSRTLLMVNHEYTVEEAESLVKDGKIDLVSFGRPFIYNPDLVTRLEKGLPFATNDRGGFVNYGPYKHVNENYNDWPTVCAA